MQDTLGNMRHGFVQIPGVRTHFVEAGWKHEKLAILLHGFPDFWFGWRHQIPFLCKHLHVIAIDQRGYNLTSKPKGVSRYHLDALVSDVKHLVESFGHEKCILVGHDWGGAVSWEFARQHPAMIEKLCVLNCPPVQLLMQEQFKNVHQLLSSYYIYLFQIPILPEFLLSKNGAVLLAKMLSSMIPGITRQEIKIYRKGLSVKGTIRSAINYYRSAFRQQVLAAISGNQSSEISIHVPTSVIWGFGDTALQPNFTLRFRNICKRRCSIHLVDAGHFVHQEKPSVVNDIMLRELIEG
ncbi:alpha/beta fold hydrolase [Candidatus Bathyarchaeota archaeon]|nr:alpha/beta fold hydrolase [Candidatus Bathyarchaeota archaeon]